jgi:hypothetical protein
MEAWMGRLGPQLEQRPLDAILLPGTHDAGAFATNPGIRLSGFPGEF